jgi:hypothetical protein
LSFSVSGAKVKAAIIYAANSKNCGGCWMAVYLIANMARFTASSRAGLAVFGDPRSTVASGLHATDTTIMISRVDGGRNQGNPAGGRDHAPRHGRNRSGPVAGGGRSRGPPRLARVLPNPDRLIYPALDQVRRRSYRSPTIRAARDRSAVAGVSGEKREAPDKPAGRRLATAGMGY